MTTGRRTVGSERGSGSILVIGVAMVILSLLLTGVAIIAAVLASSRARTAADQAALVGAARAVAPDPGPSPCSAAAGLAARNGGQLRTCDPGADTLEVTVVVTVRFGGRDLPFGLGTAVARARAGPAPAEAGSGSGGYRGP